MKVRALKNNINDINNKYKEYSYNQDQTGEIDISIGSVYLVYGIQENRLGRFYLVLTDEINHDLPWWMPADLYEVIDETRPTSWVDHIESDEDGTVRVISFPEYFGAEEDIEERTQKGFDTFSKIQSY